MQDELILPKWNQIEVKVSDLRPFEKNPRKNTKEDFERLKASIIKFGYMTPVKATRDLRIIGGHLRKRVLTELGIKTVPVWVPEANLSDADFREIVVRDNVNNGMWDTDILSAQNDAEELIEWGLDEGWLIGKEAEEEMPQLHDGEKAPFQQMTFTLHDSQAAVVKEAIDAAKKEYLEDPNNKNGNGNALFFVCSQFIGGQP